MNRHSGVTDAWLVARGLIGSAMISEQSGSDIMTPPPGTEVDETRQTANLLKQEGTTFVGDPEVTTELIRCYISGAQPVVAAAVHASIDAVFGATSILK